MLCAIYILHIEPVGFLDTDRKQKLTVDNQTGNLLLIYDIYLALYYQEIKRFSSHGLLALNCAMAEGVVGCKSVCYFMEFLDSVQIYEETSTRFV